MSPTSFSLPGPRPAVIAYSFQVAYESDKVPGPVRAALVETLSTLDGMAHRAEPLTVADGRALYDAMGKLSVFLQAGSSEIGPDVGIVWVFGDPIPADDNELEDLARARIIGPWDQAYAGWPLGARGDLDGDGIDDLVMFDEEINDDDRDVDGFTMGRAVHIWLSGQSLEFPRPWAPPPY